MKVYFNSIGQFLEQDTTMDLFVKGNNGNVVECYFNGLDISDRNLSFRMVVKWSDGTTTNELPMVKSLTNDYVYLTLPILKVDGEAQFIIRIYRNTYIEHTAIFKRGILEGIDASDDTVTTEEYEVLLQNIDDIRNRKQDVLKSGQNIKTINGMAITGEGNLDVVTTGDRIWIRYAEDVLGTNMSAVPLPTHEYMGTYTGVTPSANASDYVWIKYSSELTTVTDGAITTEKIADGAVTPEKTTFFNVEKSSNRLDLSKITLNKYMYIDGNVSDNEAYTYTDFIPVKEGEKITFQSGEIESSLIREMRFICAFDENKNVLSDKGDANTNTLYIVPNGVAYIIITSGSEVFQSDIFPRVVNSETIVEYEPYGDNSTLKNEYIDKEYIKGLAQETFNENTNIEIVDIKDLSFTESNNLFNKDSSKNKSGFYAYEGVEYANESYYLTDYIEVEPNLIYTFNSNGGEYPYAEQYDSNKVFITNSISRDSFKIFTKQNAKYVRLSIRIDQVDSACFSKGNVAISGTKYEKLIPEKYILKENIDAFIPDEIVVAVGRTIEIYNKQVCVNAEKYHFNWVSNVGKNLKRKFSITGTSGNIGLHDLTLNIYNDEWELIFTKNIVLKIVEGLKESVSVCPIGDSLTNDKYWLNEVRNLSSNKVSFVGTRGTTNGLKHEGRSGFTSDNYLTPSIYAFENEGVQPFWNPTIQKFSWSYYKQTTGINPNMVQIFLGTNDFANNVSKETFTENIKTMIDSIRESDSSISILIVLTICWGDQNGIGKQGNTDGFATYIGMNEYEINRRTILNLQYLYETLKSFNYSNLYFVPLTECHDSEYNFGDVETPVNPRASQTESMPIEAVHPQQQGYEQMADVIYSVISYIKSL